MTSLTLRRCTLSSGMGGPRDLTAKKRYGFCMEQGCVIILFLFSANSEMTARGKFCSS